jgi:hypothetical protein
MKEIDDVVQSVRQNRFLTKEECGDDGLVATIARIIRDVVLFDGEPSEQTIVFFQEEDIKPLILRSTVALQIASIVGSPKRANWIGRKIEFFHDHTVMMAGKIVGGLRARAVSQKKNGSVRMRKPVRPRLCRKPATEEPEEIRFGASG